MKLLTCLLFIVAGLSQLLDSAPISENFEKTVDSFLNSYYDNLMVPNNDNIYDQMQGDEPIEGGITPTTGGDDIAATRERLRKDSWMQYLKSQIISSLGRNSSTLPKSSTDDSSLAHFNFTQIIPRLLNSSNLDDDQITEKIRSFYPSCEANPELDQWREENMMNLYFDFDFNADSNIASATLRLYRLPQNQTNFDNVKVEDCKNDDDEDRLLRVSVYWYLQKKRRAKHRLSDSKVVLDSNRWVELNVKPATKSWTRNGTPRNMGLAITVEDQEGKTLKANQLFKGPSCTVGISTPRPIPTIVRDAFDSELDNPRGISGRNSTTTIHSDILLLPSVDICYLELPQDADISQFDSARINACNLRKKHEENLRAAEKEQMERLASLQYPNRHNIRHHNKKQQLNNDDNNSQEEMSDLERTMRRIMNGNKQVIFKRSFKDLMQER